MNLLTLACLALQGLCMYARIVKEREAASKTTEAAPSAAPSEEPEIPTRLVVETDQGVTLSPLTLTGGAELMKSSSQDVAAGRRRPRRSKPLTATTLVEVDGLSLARPVAMSMVLEHAALCDPDASPASLPVLYVPAAPASVTPALPAPMALVAPKPARADRRTGDTWRRALGRVAITCPCAACSGLLLMLKGLSRRSQAALDRTNSWALAPAG